MMKRRDFLTTSAAVAASSAWGMPADAPAALAKPDWFPFEPRNDFGGPSIIGLADWLDKPAGKHGFVRNKGERLVFEDGTPIKFWGTNVCNARVASPAEQVDRWSDKFAKYGINLVRMHKFTWPGGGQGIGSKEDSTKLDETRAPRWDYFVASLAQRGIYTGWSHIYGHRLSPADRDRVLAYDEIMKADLPWSHLRGSSIGLVNFAKDLQDLNIALTLYMLNRKNTVTGKRYADDPSLAYIELQNEDDVFWGHTQVYLDKCPSYARLLHQQYSDWLRKKYGDEAKLRAAWGNQFKTGESLEQRNVTAYASTSLSAEVSKAVRAGEMPPPRVLDNCRFLFETQNAFYTRFVEAIRSTGYRGVIVGSCWQAGAGISHYYNLWSDRQTGLVDRHNYGGGLRPMVSAPGSALLSTGMQQLSDRPFGVSEWKSTISSPWYAEAPPIIAAYGMGLQGWDLSCEFASDFDHLSAPLGEFTCDVPGDIGQYPVLARMVHRGDVQEGKVLSVRKVSLDDLAKGRLGFEEDVRQRGDVKTISGTVPREALAVGKVFVEFVDKPTATEKIDLSRFVDAERKIVRSNTGQLTWNYSGQGFFTIDTPGTQAVVGFASGLDHKLADVTVRLETPFALIYITSLDRKKSIAQAGSLLVMALARSANTGMLVNAAGAITARGKAPVLLEPVKATIVLRRKGKYRVHALDHDGKRREGVAPFETAGPFTIDGARDRAMYYLVE